MEENTQVSECINCGWTEAGSLLSHEEYVDTRPWNAWLCIRDDEILPPRPAGAR